MSLSSYFISSQSFVTAYDIIFAKNCLSLKFHAGNEINCQCGIYSIWQLLKRKVISDHIATVTRSVSGSTTSSADGGIAAQIPR
jgi:hypothetical protein